MATKTAKQTLSAKDRAFLVAAIQEILEDPDFGLELTEKARKRLAKEKASNEETISLEEIKRKYY